MTHEAQAPLPERAMTAPAWLQRSVSWLEGAASLDRVAAAVDDVARLVAGGRAGQALRGQWLGHALHPLLTDFPLGCWIGAGLLDLLGPRPSNRAARRLVGLGVAMAVPTVLSGLAEFAPIRDPRLRRVAAVHALGNAVVVVLYVRSWTSRRRSPVAGALWGLAGGSSAWATGYLGGHLSFGRSVGVVPRGLGRGDAPSSQPDDVSLDEAADLLTVPPAQVAAMVEEGMLTADDTSGSIRLSRAEVLATRQLGG